jgi:FdhD protein
VGAAAHRGYLAASGAVSRAHAVPVEVAVNLVYATVPHAVMMATPADLEDFAVGFSLTEGIVADVGEVRGVVEAAHPAGIVLDIALAPGALRRHLARRRSLSGRTACGLCGIESLDELARAVPGPGGGVAVAEAALRRALAALPAHQPLNRATRGVHAAALCSAAGEILLAREDVGRHNALDKLAGACLRGGVEPGDGFVLLTSRCSFEMVEKAAAFGARAVVAISAPTSLAIDRALALGVTLVAVARADGALRFTPEPEAVV